MEKVINSYESIFIVDLVNGEEAAKATADKFVPASRKTPSWSRKLSGVSADSLIRSTTSPKVTTWSLLSRQMRCSPLSLSV